MRFTKQFSIIASITAFLAIHAISYGANEHSAIEHSTETHLVAIAEHVDHTAENHEAITVHNEHMANTEAHGEHDAHADEHHGLSVSAEHVFEVYGVPITNAMFTGWIISLVLILAIRTMAGGGKPKLIPTKGQVVVETLVNGIKDLIEPIVGRQMVKPAFPILAAFFTFILIHNWSGLLPGVGTIGFVNEDGSMLKAFIRPGNADLNMTLALAFVHFVAWIYLVLRYAGIKALVYDWFGNKADKKEVPFPVYLFLTVIFMAVGCIEVISTIFRNVSLPFRLFGNVFGGENLLHSMQGVAENIGLFGTLLPVPFYFLEMLIGFVQALVFTLLVAVYIGLICNHGDEEHEHAH